MYSSRFSHAYRWRSSALLLIGLGCSFCAIAEDEAAIEPISLGFTGRALIDAHIVSERPAFDEVEDVQIRSARLGVEARVFERAQLKLELNVSSSGAVDLADANIKIGDEAGAGSFTIGRYKPPASLDDRTSSRFTQTFERAGFVSALNFDRETGVWFQKRDAGQTFALSLSSPSSLTKERTFAGFYSRQWRSNDYFQLHYGGSFRVRDFGAETNQFGYDARPYSRALSANFDLNSKGESEVAVIGELIAQISRLWVSAEVTQSETHCDDCIDRQRLSGGYLDLKYIIGGNYRFEGGEFRRPSIGLPIECGGRGALSVGLRFDALNADFGDRPKKYDTIFAFDWWPSENARIGINVFHSEFSNNQSVRISDSGAVIRTQIDF